MKTRQLVNKRRGVYYGRMEKIFGEENKLIARKSFAYCKRGAGCTLVNIKTSGCS